MTQIWSNKPLTQTKRSKKPSAPEKKTINLCHTSEKQGNRLTRRPATVVNFFQPFWSWKMLKTLCFSHFSDKKKRKGSESARRQEGQRAREQERKRARETRQRRCEDVKKMRRWEDLKMRKCDDEKMRRCQEGVKMRSCDDQTMWVEFVKIRSCQKKVHMRRCEDEKMWSWEAARRY